MRLFFLVSVLVACPLLCSESPWNKGREANDTHFCYVTHDGHMAFMPMMRYPCEWNAYSFRPDGRYNTTFFDGYRYQHLIVAIVRTDRNGHYFEGHDVVGEQDEDEDEDEPDYRSEIGPD